MRPVGTAEELERRRQRAVTLVLEHDYSRAEAADAVGVARRTVQRWIAAYRADGNEGIAPIVHPGRPSTLGEKDLRKLEKILLKGPVAFGFPNELWTCERIGMVIAHTFGVSFHRSHVWRILQGMGWTPQKPERRAVERDEDGIEKFIKIEWKKLVKKARKRAPP